jgi:hypothetical protein
MMWFALFSSALAAAICLGVAAVVIQGGRSESANADALHLDQPSPPHFG